MKRSFVSRLLAPLFGGTSESYLRSDSPVHVWLTRSGENSEAGSGVALLSALTDPASTWADRAVGYAALRKIELSPTERVHANYLLGQSLERFRLGRDLLSRLGKFVIPVGVLSLAVSFLLTYQTANRKEAAQALKAILPTVTTDWYGRLPSGVSAILMKMAWSFDEDLAWPALDALGRVGGGECVESVERLARGAEAKQVRARAAAILPILIDRRTRETSSASLLRPSQAITAENLLLPVYGSEPDVTNLLRASHRDSQDIEQNLPK